MGAEYIIIKNSKYGNRRKRREREFGKAKDKLGNRINDVLIIACWKGDFSTVQKTIELGADVNSTDLDGKSALEWARKSGNEALVNYLILKGAKDK